MNPHKQLTAFDQKGIAYVVARLDVPIGQNLMKFVEYEVLSHDAEWVELREHGMQIKTGPRNGTYFSKADLEKQGSRNPVWHRWAEIAPLEIRPQ